MPDIIADNAHRTAITAKFTMAASKSKRLDKLCENTKTLFQSKQWRKIGLSKSPRSSESSTEQSTAQGSAASQQGSAYVLPPLPQASSMSFEESCRESFDEVVKNSHVHNTTGVRIIVTAPPPAAVESIGGKRKTYPIPALKDLPQDSFDLVREPNSDTTTSQKLNDGSPVPESERSMSEVVRKTMDLVAKDPRGKALMDAGRNYLRVADAAKATAERNLLVCFQQLREREADGGGVETVRETMRTMRVTQLTTMQELRYKLQREAVRLLNDESIIPGEIFGMVFLVLMGSTSSVLEKDDWNRMRMGLPSEDMSLRFSFQVRKLEGGDE